MNDRNAVLVTGASGLVGAEVVSRLTTQGRPVIAVTHRVPNIVDSTGSRLDSTALDHVTGNVRQPRFGFDAPTVAELGFRVGTIVHCAATTDFAASEQDYADLNLGGTVHACELARTWDVPLVQVSTAYVCGGRAGRIAEDDRTPPPSFHNGYEHSKYEAEQYIRGLEGLRWSIVRPGIVTGCVDTGAIRDYKNVYTIVKLMVEGRLRTLPGRYAATLSLAPVDYVADAVVAATVNFAAAEGTTFHAVGAAPISLRDVSQVFAEYPSFEVARFVPGSAFSPDRLDSLEREYYLRIGAQYSSYFEGSRDFDTTNTATVLGVQSPATGKDYLRTLLDYCLETGYLGSPRASIDEVVQCFG